MKFKSAICMTAITALAALAIPLRFAARGQENSAPPRYRVINLGTLEGGSASGADSLDDLGVASGFSTLASDNNSTDHAALWFDGLKLDLGTLGGPNSGVFWPVKNNIGLISGVSETADLNSLNEDWSCSAFFPSITHHNCVGFVWLFGQMFPLPTLGGFNGFATGSNNRGQIVGWAENSTHDPTCKRRNQVLQFEAVIWGPRLGEIHALPPFPNDLDGAATAINEHGQVVGISGICDQAVGASSAIHALLWQDGQPTDLGNLGGHGWNTPMAINNQSVIVGFANLPDDIVNGELTVNFIGFVWTKEHGMQKIPLLDGDSIAEATGINDGGQIVGVSFGNPDFPLGRAFLFENGKLTDLNQLIPSDGPLSLTGNTDLDINDRGEIAGQACVLSNGACTAELPAFKLVPMRDDDHRDSVVSEFSATRGNPQKLMRHEDIRSAVQLRRGFARFVPFPADRPTLRDQQ
jgi:probable HAF family extracellular repeat protein